MSQSRKNFDIRRDIQLTLTIDLGRLPTREEYKLELSKRGVYLSKRTIDRDIMFIKFIIEQEQLGLKARKEETLIQTDTNLQTVENNQHKGDILENQTPIEIKTEEAMPETLQPTDIKQHKGDILEIIKEFTDSTETPDQVAEIVQHVGDIIEKITLIEVFPDKSKPKIHYKEVESLLKGIPIIGRKTAIIKYLKDHNLIQDETYQLEMLRILNDSHVISKYTFMVYERAHSKRLERYEKMRVKSTLIMY